MSQVWSQVGNFVWPYLFGQFDSPYFSFYEFMFNVLNIRNPVEDLFDHYLKTTESGIIYSCDDFCVISNKQSKILMREGRLHANGSPAIEYNDGFKVWSLNGVMVPQYLAETPESKLDLEFFKKEQNVEVRAQFIRKYGIDRMKKQGKLKENNDVYELIDMSPIFTQVKYAPYLFMINPSTGTIHAEGVHPDCKTIEQALNWRNQSTEKPVVLT